MTGTANDLQIPNNHRGVTRKTIGLTIYFMNSMLYSDNKDCSSTMLLFKVNVNQNRFHLNGGYKNDLLALFLKF